MSAEVKDQLKRTNVLTPEEGRAWFDKLIPEMLDITGEEYLRRYDAGEYDDVPDEPEYWKFIEAESLIALVRPNR